MRERRVYFLRAIGGGGLIKIGSSEEPEGRLRTFMAWSPVRLEMLVQIPGTFQLERNIHDCFADAHSHSEWFHPTTKLLAAIAALQAGVPVEQAIDLSDCVASVRGKINRHPSVRSASDKPVGIDMSYAAIGRALGVSRQLVATWFKRQVPAERVHNVARVTGVPAHKLRPDLFSPLDRAG